jgi:hypothetical protein
MEKYPALSGQIFAQFSSDPDQPEVYIDGDPEGLRSLAALLIAMADLDQRTVLELPDDAREHLHLCPGAHLGENSARLIISRADQKRGALDDIHQPRVGRPAKF